ncbi:MULTISPECIES: hypothetical protein [unclassified Bifidobacterium]|uniref:hypothetical protein n=1 Tax=unclassified Bifidobacterium TaxID=2608897 RepID=UPI0015E2782D|nr:MULTISPECIES: hypothetical protein [unclassified Bifidobacterium]TPF78586.1 membrane protein [Bifidobacterium sp. UTCIF-1]TPF80867.1 membrane protein [Bifidobacterium sp. UTCIF-24]TPF82694.1 membrane protein [Bifidobacterium sp. UTCIF-3]TPF84532.1 membrane protein [Bifidobacterium sp. UTCIF-36]TPF90907.1 membrane protein [Bifidobacterium sp. UTBIF-56]
MTNVALARKVSRPNIVDLTDSVLYAALIMLPAGGTVFGLNMMYWSPISPVLFAIYAVLNIRYLPRVFARYGTLLLFPVALVMISVYGWMTIGFHPNTALRTLAALVTGVSCLISLDIAFRIKRLNWNAAITVIVVAYTVSFGVGILQFIAVHGHAPWMTMLSQRFLERNYVPNRVQFLFAEPSYIGMHLFGVLMPLQWLTRRKDIAALILMYAFGSAAMGAGLRILVDMVIALLLWVIVLVNFHRLRNIIIALVGVGVVGAAGGAVLLTNDRIQLMLSHGLISGDFSSMARLFRALAPVEAWLADIPHLVFGFGAGNLKDAIARGYQTAFNWLQARGDNPAGNGEIRLLGSPPGDHYIFSMSAYIDFITEFGAVMFIALLALILVHVTRCRAWNKMTVCWMLLLAYLYVQFEGYAFYAIWLFLWAAGVAGLMGSLNSGVDDVKRIRFAHKRGKHLSE